MDGLQLRELREKLKLTQAEMGEKLGISASAVWKLEAGENTMSKPVSIICGELVSKT